MIATDGVETEVTPTLVQGTGPFTWSILTPAQPPTGMAINADTGVLTWTASEGDGSVEVTIQVSTAQGTDTVTWRMFVEQPNVVSTDAPLGFVVEGDVVFLPARVHAGGAIGLALR